MSHLELQQLILDELRDLKTELREVRQTDIPGIKTDVAGFNVQLRALERQQTWTTRIYTVLGGAIAVFTSRLINHP